MERKNVVADMHRLVEEMKSTIASPDDVTEENVSILKTQAEQLDSLVDEL